MPAKFTFILLFVFFSMSGMGRDIYVATNGVGGGDPLYGAWENASSNIAWAVKVGTNGDKVWISNGTYYLTNQITVNSNITICGNRGELVVVDSSGAHRCFYFPSTANKVGVLSNLFITGGYTNSHGAGVYMSYGGVLDCVFYSNSCPAGVAGLFHGGGMYFLNTGTVQRCRFIANVASSNGGGLYAANAALITDCAFVTNVAGDTGGGVYLNDEAILTGCLIASNTAVANDGGGVCADDISLIYNCYLSNNIAKISGGGAALTAGSIISNCVVARNRALGTGNEGGGGVYISSSYIRNCIIEENTASASGGGIFGYSGKVRNCLIRNNKAAIGGGMRCYQDNLYISSCTIVSNYASDVSSSRGGGGIIAQSATAPGRFDNCIIYFNGVPSGSLSNYSFGAAGTHIGSTFSNCCFAPELPADITSKSTNSISADPQFVNWPGSNYR